MSTLLAILASALTLIVPADTNRTVTPVTATGAPVTLDGMKLLNTDAQPLVLLYAATNKSDAAIDQFTVMVFVYDKDGRLKARQVAPGRRDLAVRETKYSSMVLDVGTIEATDSLMAGVDQVQRVGSDEWWRADLRPLAEAAADAKRAPAPPKR
jgi:hypothetical protein